MTFILPLCVCVCERDKTRIWIYVLMSLMCSISRNCYTRMEIQMCIRDRPQPFLCCVTCHQSPSRYSDFSYLYHLGQTLSLIHIYWWQVTQHRKGCGCITHGQYKNSSISNKKSLGRPTFIYLFFMMFKEKLF